MNLTEVMSALERAGSEGTRKTLQRHGARPPLFGVSYGDLYGLQKRLGTDHPLAQQLWNSGNHDARVLATLIADTGRANDPLLEELLPRIARSIHAAPNSARHAMNSCLIAIGGRPALTEKALAAAKQ